MLMIDDLISPTAAAAELGISEKTLYRWRGQGKGPPAVQSQPALYSRDALRSWRASHAVVTSVRYVSVEGA
jgi:hypothetical protein